MTTYSTHHSSYRSTGAAALATALIVGGVAAAGMALASTHGSAVPVTPAQVEAGPLPGLHDFTAAGKGQAAPHATPPQARELQLRRVPRPRG